MPNRINGSSVFMAARNQSMVTGSFPAIVDNACHVVTTTELENQRTVPSANAAFTPPACLLRAAAQTLPLARLRVQLSSAGIPAGMGAGGQPPMMSVPAEFGANLPVNTF